MLFLNTEVEFGTIATGCIPPDFKPGESYHLYVEMTLSSCKNLCVFQHDSTCTLIIFLPKVRSCILLPWRNITIVDNSDVCELVELHRKYRRPGKQPFYLHGPLTHWGRDKMESSFQTIFSNGYSWMKMYEIWLKFHWSLFLRVQLIQF